MAKTVVLIGFAILIGVGSLAIYGCGSSTTRTAVIKGSSSAE